MKTLFRNFTHTFKRFITVNLLNLLGLSIAFASFFIIMTQVDYDYNYNKCYKDYGNIYRLEMHINNEWGWSLAMPRPLGEFIDSVSPHIKAGAMVETINMAHDFEVNDHIYNEQTLYGVSNFLKVFQPEMVQGSTEGLRLPDNCVIPETMARRFFGSADAVGKVIYYNKKADNKPITICGVYKDFPENSQLGNNIFLTKPDSIDKDEWSNFNYYYYLRTDGSTDPSTFYKAIKDKIRSINPEAVNSEFSIRFAPLKDAHFSSLETSNASKYTTVYFLFCSAFLIVLIAGINYMNFNLAETPLRIKSINTQKVLGASTTTLRRSFVLESMIVAILAGLIGIFWVHIIQFSPLSDIVEARINFYEHVDLICATLGMSAIIGIFAGIYPAYYSTSFPPALVLKGSFGLSPKGKIMRTSLICFQYIISFVLTIFVLVMFLQSHYIRTSDYGFDKDEIIMGELTNEVREQSDAVANDIKQIPGVSDVAYSLAALSSADSYMSWGRGDEQHTMKYECIPVDYNYLKVMGIKITEGRDFRQGDGDVYIFNEAAKKKYPWLKLDKAILAGEDTVIGFCQNVQFTSFRMNSGKSPMAFIVYGKKRKGWEYKATINIRVTAGADKFETMNAIKNVLAKYTPNHDFVIYYTDQMIDKTYKKEQMFIKQILVFSILTIFISIIGVLGLTIFESEYRRKEIGIRKVMGSSTREILLMFNKRYQKILLGCFIVAVPIGYYFSARWLQSFADHTPIYWWIFLIAYILLTVLTVATVTFQSWKNANDNPINSIKTE